MNEKKKANKEKEDALSYPLTPDRTANENFYARSKKIRWRIYRSLSNFSMRNLSFADPGDLADRVANDAKCSSECSARWIKQYTSLNGDFFYFDDWHRLAWKRKPIK